MKRFPLIRLSHSSQSPRKPRLNSSLTSKSFKNEQAKRKIKELCCTSRLKVRDVIEIDDNLDLSLTLETQNSRTKFGYDISIIDEIKSLEEQLDTQEIELRTYNYTNKNDPKTGEVEWQAYTHYMQGIINSVKKRDQRIGNCLIRGLSGCIRAVSKIQNKRPEEKYIACESSRRFTREQYTQTYSNSQNYTESSFVDDISPEIEALKNLSKKISDLNNEALAKKLKDLYESLRMMYSDVPSPCETPKLFELENGEVANDIRNTMKAFQEELQYQITKKQLLKIKHDHSVQTDFEVMDASMYGKLQEQFTSKEVELFQLKYRYECALEENKKLEEAYTRYQKECEESQRRIKVLEDEAKNVFDRNNKLTQYESDLNYQLIDLTQGIQKRKEKIAKLRKDLEEAEEDIDHKREKLDKFRNELDETTEQLEVKTKKLEIAEQKLSIIERAWKTVHRRSFMYEKEGLIEAPKLKIEAISTLDPIKSRVRERSITPSPTNIFRKRSILSPSPIPSNADSPALGQSESYQRLRKQVIIENSSGLLSNISGENEFLNSLSAEQLEFFFRLRSEEREEKFRSKIANLSENSKAIQYIYVEPVTEEMIAQHIVKRRYTQAREPPERKIVAEETKDDSFAETARILAKDAEFEMLSPNLKMDLLKAMEGHDTEKCGSNCVHLKRAMMIKQKARGAPYPLKRATIASIR
ncbi:unnamed protein product [Blepharisma stoltei]|uniref:Uncharacterized protein n=1 Tax=Blepharisma stoltei TaxID=1481888 RepID=A0AAU9IZX9_9CILI|nr:unnamed protein product [Blepharisma stoltei]